MDYDNLKLEQKEDILEKLRQVSPDVNIDTDKISISKASNGLKVSYNGVNVEIPLPPPDQQTANSIWSFLAGGAVAIGAVAVTLFLGSKDKDKGE